MLDTQTILQDDIVNNNLIIYSNNYYLRLEKALSTNYPVLKIYVGADKFKILCHTYIKKYPSTHWSIRWFGNYLYDHINNPALKELVQLEWTLGLISDAPNAPVLNQHDIHTIPLDNWKTMRFQLHPSVYYLSFSYNIMQMWRAIINNPAVIPEFKKLKKTRFKTHWLLWRQEINTRYYKLSKTESACITAIFNFLPFGKLCEKIFEQHNHNTGHQAALLLQKALTAGLIAGITL